MCSNVTRKNTINVNSKIKKCDYFKNVNLNKSAAVSYVYIILGHICVCTYGFSLKSNEWSNLHFQSLEQLSAQSWPPELWHSGTLVWTDTDDSVERFRWTLLSFPPVFYSWALEQPWRHLAIQRPPSAGRPHNDCNILYGSVSTPLPSRASSHRCRRHLGLLHLFTKIRNGLNDFNFCLVESASHFLSGSHF